MRRHTIPTFLLAAALAAGCTQDAPTAAAPDAAALSMGAAHCENVRAEGVGWFTSPTTGEGIVTGDLQGTFTFEITHAQPHGQAGQGALHGRISTDWDLEGGELFTSDIAVVTPSGQFNERSEVLGGTGTYAGAWGRLNLRGTIMAGIGNVTWQGRICTP